ncbi:hypothetical protein [Streptosporangium sp. 'caverna']|uniref:hypothetical protein n=1 Tax=Streptosporangium sp. 'caverna' TaxID=2202249 RepID=UPI0013A6BB93|nr:hypothetical protein [Streptosporangium sp. 'caverna']
MSASSTSDRLPERLVAAGLVGVIMPFIVLAWVVLMVVLFNDTDEYNRHFELSGLFTNVFVGGCIAIVLAWPLLYLLRVRPAWPVAILAVFFLAVIWQLSKAGWSNSSFLIVLGCFTYPLAAVVTAPRLRWLWRVLPVTLFLGLYLFAVLFPG